MLFDFQQKPAPTFDEIVSRPKAIVIKGLWTDDDEHAYFKGYRYESEADALADTGATDLDDEIRNRKCRDEDDLVDNTEYWYRFSSVDKWDNESAKSAPASAWYRKLQSGDFSAGAVDATAIAPNSATTAYDDAPSGSLSLSAASETEAASISGIDLSDAYNTWVYIEFTNNDGAVGRNFDVNLYDGTTPILHRTGLNVNDQGLLNLMFPWVPSSGGLHTFDLKLECPNATAVKGRRLMVLVFKR